jgi:hypothetical protein
MYQEKISLLKYNVEYNKKFRISENILDCQVIDFFSYLRFLLYEEDFDNLIKMINENYKLMMDDSSTGFYLISPLSAKNELKVLKKIEDLCLNELNKYPHTLEEDEDIIKKDKNKEINLTNNKRNCVIMRMSEKRILKFFIKFSKYCSELFGKTEKVKNN